MTYEEKTDWLPDDPINEDDVNRWEKGIKDAHTDMAAHKNDMNNPTTQQRRKSGWGMWIMCSRRRRRILTSMSKIRCGMLQRKSERNGMGVSYRRLQKMMAQSLST